MNVSSEKSGEKLAFAAVLICLAALTANAFRHWNFLRVGLGHMSPYSIFRDHDQLRMTQALMLVFLFCGWLRYELLRPTLSHVARWVCFLVMATAAGHLCADLIIRVFI
jgi:hypothetical protein